MTLTDLTPSRVLLAEPTPADRDYITLFLQQCGVRHVLGVATGSDAYHTLANSPKPLDSIIANLTMPNGTGTQLLQALRCNEVRGTRADLCVLLMSETWSKEALIAARSLDVSGVLIKPFAPDKPHTEILGARRRVRPIDIAKHRSVIMPLA